VRCLFRPRCGPSPGCQVSSAMDGRGGAAGAMPSAGIRQEPLEGWPVRGGPEDAGVSVQGGDLAPVAGYGVRPHAALLGLHAVPLFGLLQGRDSDIATGGEGIGAGPRWFSRHGGRWYSRRGGASVVQLEERGARGGGRRRALIPLALGLLGRVWVRIPPLASSNTSHCTPIHSGVGDAPASSVSACALSRCGCVSDI